MKRRFSLAVIFLFLGLLGMSTDLAYAYGWHLGSGYDVTSNYHGMFVWPLPQDVTAAAATTEHPSVNRVPEFPDVTAVRFRWMPPADSGLSEFYSPVLSVAPMLLWDSGEDYEDNKGGLWDIYIAEDTQTIPADGIGDWGVQAWFYDTDGNLRHSTGVAKIRATSFNAVPEVPFGTIAALVGMLGALGVFAIKKKVFVPRR